MAAKPKKATTKRQSAATGVIKLTPKQRAFLKKESGGRIDAHTLLLRPSLDFDEFLRRVAKGAAARAEEEPATKVKKPLSVDVAPPPKGSTWVA